MRPSSFLQSAAQAATEREVAEWVLRWEGSLILEGSNAPIRDLSLLPAGDFHIASIDLTATVMHPVELRKLEGLTHLRQLYLPGRIWNPGAGNEDKTGVFEALASLTSVERLAFSWHFNSNIRCRRQRHRQADSLAWSQAISLRAVRARETQVVGILGIARPRSQRQSLHRRRPGFDRRAKEPETSPFAKHADHRRWPQEYLKGLTDLEELDLSGTRITGRGIEHLKNLKSLRSLNLLGAQVPDESMDILAGMKSLEVLNLYRTLVTNSGLASLHSLKNLTDVDVRYSRVTNNGVEALRAALPEIKVRFDGAALSKTPREGAAKPADSSPQAIAKWVRLMGGSADLVDGQLTSVNLASTSLSDAQLAFLENLHDLQKLDIQVTQVSDLGLNSVQRLTGLRELNLSNTTVSSTGLAKLAALSHLETLNVAGTLVDGTGWRN